MHDFLVQAVILLSGAVILVPLFKKIGLGSVLGYLIAGLLVGPSLFALIKETESALHFAELGVVLLLFIIGLELNPRKLWRMRKEVVGVGFTQVSVTSIVIAVILMLMGLKTATAVALGLGLALSSTAIALQTLQDKNRLGTPGGQATFGTLLMQDIAVIPMLAVLPLLSDETSNSLDIKKIGIGIAAVLFVIIVIPLAMRPILRYVASIRIREVFTALALLLVLGISLLMEEVGLSMALGSFLAGVVLAESEYRHQLESDIEPFKGLLLGLFFMAVGMNINLWIILEKPFLIFFSCLALLAIKATIFYTIARMNKLPANSSLLAAATIAQGGEFAFVFLQVAIAHKVIDSELMQITQSTVALSMAFTPVFLLIAEQFAHRMTNEQETQRAPDKIEPEGGEVVICGYGRFGQMIGRVLNANGFQATVLDHDATQIDLLRKFGIKVFYGDATREDLLESCGLNTAKAIVIALDDIEATMTIIEYVKKHHPHLKILARCRNRPEAYDLLDLNISHYYRETFDSALRCAEDTLTAIGFQAARSKSIIEKFRRHDIEVLEKSAKVHKDQKQLISIAQESREELAKLLQEEVTEAERA